MQTNIIATCFMMSLGFCFLGMFKSDNRILAAAGFFFVLGRLIPAFFGVSNIPA